MTDLKRKVKKMEKELGKAPKWVEYAVYVALLVTAATLVTCVVKALQ